MLQEQDLTKVKVQVKSLVGGKVGYPIAHRNIKREWDKQGRVLAIPADELQEALYNQAVETLFTEGYLGIENKEHRILLNLEQEDALEEEQLIPFTNIDAKKLLLAINDPGQLRLKIAALNANQKDILIAAAIEIKDDLNLVKVEIVNEVCKVDLVKLAQNATDLQN